MDTAQLVEDDTGCRVVDGDSAECLREWSVLPQVLGIRLDRLVVAQGAEYWRWY